MRHEDVMRPADGRRGAWGGDGTLWNTCQRLLLIVIVFSCIVALIREFMLEVCSGAGGDTTKVSDAWPTGHVCRRCTTC